MFLRQLKSQIQASSIGRSLILVSVITSSVITLLFTSLQIYLDIQREKKYVEKSMHEIQTIYNETLPAAIWDLSVTNIQQHASSISQMKFVSRVRISGDGFDTIEYKSNNFPNGPSASFPLYHHEFLNGKNVKSYYDNSESKLVGKLELDMSYSPVYTDITQRVLFSLAANFLKTIIVTAVLLSLYFRWVTSPVLKLTQKAKNFKIFQKETMAEVRPHFLRRQDNHSTIHPNNKNEIEILAAYFEGMQKYFRESFFLILDSEDRFKHVALKGLDCVFETDLNFNITYAISNEKFQKQNQLNFTIGKTLTNSGLPNEITGQLHVHSNEKVVMDDFLFTLKNPLEHKYYLFTIRPFVANDHTISGYRGYIEDITEKIVANEKIGKQQDQIRQIQKLETIGELAAGIAHDFNNVLTIIDGKSTLINLYLQKPENLKIANEGIHQAVLRGRKLTGRLLQFSRKQSSDVQIIRLDQQLESLKDLLTVAVSKRVELKLEFEPELWHCSIDVNMFDNAIINLCVNARDAMPDGGEIHIRLKNTVVEFEQFYLREGQYVTLEVQDSGTGMPAEILTQIFEPFFTTKGTDKGTGLGLNMVKQFVRASKGHIEVDSKINEGTTFRIFFPRAISVQKNLTTENNVTNLVVNADQSAWIQPDTSIDKTKKSA